MKKETEMAKTLKLGGISIVPANQLTRDRQLSWWRANSIRKYLMSRTVMTDGVAHAQPHVIRHVKDEVGPDGRAWKTIVGEWRLPWEPKAKVRIRPVIIDLSAAG
jgi:hypothetical protein